MRLGYLTDCTAEECRLAAELGFDCVEVHGRWEVEQLRKPAFRKREAARIREMLRKAGPPKGGLAEARLPHGRPRRPDVSISAIAVYRAGPFVPAERIELYRLQIQMCEALGVPVLTTLTGGDPAKSLDQNLEDFAAVFREVAPAAADAGVRIAFENWPGLGLVPPIGTVNFGFTPAVWERMFDAVPGDALGLEFDPSHLVWQQIDWLATLRRFAGRVYHVHAKDTEIFADRLARDGFFSHGWWRYRIPGYGVVNWHALTSTLKEHGYDGGVCIEHEDPVFSGERRAEGLRKGHDYLRPLM
jgi:sugar phosphate isomerase/epimerase